MLKGTIYGCNYTNRGRGILLIITHFSYAKTAWLKKLIRRRYNLPFLILLIRKSLKTPILLKFLSSSG